MVFPSDDLIRLLQDCSNKLQNISRVYRSTTLQSASEHLQETFDFLSGAYSLNIYVHTPEDFENTFKNRALLLQQLITGREAQGMQNPDHIHHQENQILESVSLLIKDTAQYKTLIALKKENIQLYNTMATLKEETKQREKEAKSAIDEIEKRVSELASQSNQEGLNIFDAEFKKLQEEHKTSTRFWLIFLTLFLALCSITLLFLSSEKGFNALIPLQLRDHKDVEWLYFTSKIFIYGLLIYLVIFCAKNYSRSKHNEIVFGHRSASVNAISLIYNALKDNNAKNVVIKEASKSIFSHINTGYISHNSDEMNDADSVPLQQLINVSRDN